MRTLILIAAVLAVTLSKVRVTPNTKLSESFDNLLANHKTSRVLGQALNAKLTQAFTFTADSKESLIQSLAEALPWLDQESLKQFDTYAPQVLLGDIQSHYVFIAFPTEAVFRFALINFYKDVQGQLTYILAQQEREAFGIQSTAVYHDMRVSEFGLDLSEPVVLNSVGEHRVEFHSFNKDSILTQIKEIRASQKNLGFSPMAALAGAQTAITGFADAYKSIATAFKTVKSDTFKEKIAGAGFDKYTSKTRVMKSLGVPDSQWDRYIAAIGKLMELSKHPEVQGNITAIMELATFVPDSSWIANDMTFDKQKDSQGECSTIVALTQKDYMEERSNVILAFTAGTFTLARDMLIYTKYRSYAGGIYEETKDEIKYNARAITDEEIKMVHATMMLSGIQTMAEFLDLKISLPPLDIIIRDAK